jgi:hypothetical protein
MSTFGWSNISGIDDDSGATPGGINGSVQFNDNGINFAGVSDFTYNDATKTLNVVNIAATSIVAPNISAAGTDKCVQYNRSGMLAGDTTFQYDESLLELQVPKINTTGIYPGVIQDRTFSIGANTQILSNNGDFNNNLVWINNPNAVGGPTSSIQFNNSGVFDGSANFVRNLSTGDVNINANLGVGSLTAPTDRLVVTGPNATLRVKSTGTNNGNLVLEDSSSGVKQLQMFVNVDTADFVSIQQGSGFRNFRFNTGQSTSCIAVGTTGAQAIGGLMCSNALSNRKIILNTVANDEHQNYSLGINPNTFRFQIPTTSERYTWNAATASNASNELMRLTGTGNLAIGTTSANAQLQLSNASSNRKIVLFESVNNEHQFFGLGINTSTFRFQIDNTANRYAWFAGVNASSSNELMRLNGNGTLSIGNTNSTFPLEVTGTIRSTSVRPNTILDTSNSAGTAGQLLSSTGTAIQWINPPAGGANTNVQFNSAGSLGGSNNFTYTDTTSHLKVQGLLTVGNLFTTVPRIFAQSGSANSAVSSWNDQWIMAGGGSGAANSAGIGIGFNNTNVSGIIACSEPSGLGFRPIEFSASRYEFKTDNVIRMRVETTGTGAGVVIVPVLQATNIFDGMNTVGTDGQVLSSTGIGLLWKSPAPYCAIINGSAPPSGFSAGTGIPPIGTVANATFGAFPRTSSYRISTSVTGFSGGSNAINNMQIWYRTTSGNPWVLLHTCQNYFNSASFHLPYPTKSSIISITAGNPLQILVRALTPNTTSDNNDFFNIEILECTI